MSRLLYSQTMIPFSLAIPLHFITLPSSLLLISSYTHTHIHTYIHTYTFSLTLAKHLPHDRECNIGVKFCDILNAFESLGRLSTLSIFRDCFLLFAPSQCRFRCFIVRVHLLSIKALSLSITLYPNNIALAYLPFRNTAQHSPA